MRSLGRLLTAMITPFDERGDADPAEAARLAEWLVLQGSDGVVVAGTTGEAPTIVRDEEIALFSAVKERLGKRGTVIAGTGNNDTRASVALTRDAERCGVDGILAVVPYYNKPAQDGMLLHFGAIAEATSLPVILYNIPGRTGTNMLPSTVRELARRHQNIVGVKESSGDFAQFSAILRERAEGFSFWCGDDHLFLPALAIGGDGLISVAAHVCGRRMREMLDAHDRGEVALAAKIHLELTPLFAALFATTSPIGVKWAVNQLGFRAGGTRPPLSPLPPDLQAALGRLLEPYRAAAQAPTVPT
jgi:4-hydroxy-tetrahydrodipicolinate synthase